MLDDMGFQFQREQEFFLFSESSMPDVELILYRIQWTPLVLSGAKWPGRAVNHSVSYSPEAENGSSFTPALLCVKYDKLF